MGIRHHLIEKGTGEPFILLHGNGEDSTYFTAQIDYFSQFYRVLALDTRGHGKTPRGDRPFTIRQFAEDLREWMDRAAIPAANILGFSDGGNIAMVFAIRYPDRVKCLVLNGANLNPAGVKAHVQIPIEIGYKTAAVFARISSRAKRRAELLGLMVLDPALEESALRKIQAKTLVIAGTRDIIREQHTKQIYHSLPNAELVLIEGGHFIAKETPDAFNLAVERFLKKRP